MNYLCLVIIWLGLLTAIAVVLEGLYDGCTPCH